VTPVNKREAPVKAARICLLEWFELKNLCTPPKIGAIPLPIKFSVCPSMFCPLFKDFSIKAAVSRFTLDKFSTFCLGTEEDVNECFTGDGLSNETIVLLLLLLFSGFIVVRTFFISY
jgi:hypothetical protein